MITVMIAHLLLAALAAPQDPPTPPQLPGEVVDEPTPLFAVDGLPVAPGRVPEGTDEQARVLWSTMVGATHASAQAPIRSFTLNFDVASHRADATNQFKAGISYLEDDHPRSPFVRMHLERRDLVSMYGPTGSFLVDGEEVQRLTGRQAKNDLDQLNEYRNLAQNLIALTDPQRLRVVEMRALEVIPTTDDGPWAERRISFKGAVPLDLPDRKKSVRPDRQTEAQYADVLRAYAWIEVRSPDLRVHQAAGVQAKDAVYRAKFATEDGQVRLVVLMAETPDGVPLPHSAVLIEVQSYVAVGKHRLPRRFTITEIDPDTTPLTFHKGEQSKLALLVEESAVNDPALAAADFEPPKK